MLTTLRGYINTWPIRILFLLLVGSFALWGVADVVRNVFGGSETAVATVGGQTIELPDLQAAYQQQMAQVGRMFGANFSPTPEIKRSVANQALERLVTQAVLRGQARRMGLAVTDDAVRTATFAIPAFRGANGQFDRATFQTVLQNNGLDEGRFLALMRDELLQRELMGAVRAGGTAPETLIQSIFAFQQEKRVADAVVVPFSSAAPPQAPTDAQLDRWWANHPEDYSRPEYRRIKAVILSAQTIARSIEVPEDALHSAYDQRQSLYNQAEKRSVEVLLTSDETHAEALAAQWRTGADWAQMQKAASASGAAAVELPDADRAEFPDPTLAEAVFAAAPDSVPPPIHDQLGWHVVKVTGVVPARHQSFDDVKEQLHQQLAEQQAADQVYDRANKVEDALGSGEGLDNLPADLGLAAVTGTLDAVGETPDGLQAPIPGAPSVRNALIAAAFQMKVGDPAHLTEVPAEAAGGQAAGPASYYAVTVESITPPAHEPFDQVKERVRADWTRNAMHHETETKAASILAAVKDGQPLSDAAIVAKLSIDHLPPTGRQAAVPGMPSQLVQPLFGMKPGEATMVETPDGFVVAVLTQIQTPDAKSDPIGFGQMRLTLDRSLADDIEATYLSALRARSNPRINQALLNSVAQP
jgi:peptidyl-prolyl cis-trans isomerase D